MADRAWFDREDHESEPLARGYDVGLDGDVGNWDLMTEANDRMAVDVARAEASGMHLSTDAVDEAGRAALDLAVQKFDKNGPATLKTWLHAELKFRMIDHVNRPEVALPAGVDAPPVGDEDAQAPSVPLVLQANSFDSPSSGLRETGDTRADPELAFGQFLESIRISDEPRPALAFAAVEKMTRVELDVTLARDGVHRVTHRVGDDTLEPERSYADIGAELGMTGRGARTAHQRAQRKAGQAV